MTIDRVHLVTDGSVDGQRLQQVLAAADNLTVDCAVAFGPQLREMLSGCGDELAVFVVLSQTAPGPRARAATLLSGREQEVIELIAQARTNAQIARRLGIAEGTVKRHVNSIFIKLNAVSRLDAVNKYAALCCGRGP